MKYFVWIFVLLGAYLSVIIAQEDDSNDDEIEATPRNISFEKTRIDPKHLGGARWEISRRDMNEPPLKVFFSIDIIDISQVSVVNGEFRLDMNLRQRWDEKMLELPDGLFKQDDPPSARITLDGDVLQDIWTPALFVPNAKTTVIEKLTSEQKSVEIFKNLTIIYNSNVHIILSCPMELRWYPCETQYCRLFLESYAFSTDNVIFDWDIENVPVPILLPPNFRLRQYKLILPLKYLKTNKTRYGRKELYSRLTVFFVLKRELGHYIIQTFIPSFLIVALSWFSFWLGVDAIPGRVSLLVTSMLSLVTLSAGKTDLPPVAYIKMMDIWMFVCLAFVFAAMFEFIVVRYIWHRDEESRHVHQNHPQFMNQSDLANEFRSPYYEYSIKRNQNFKSNLSVHDEMNLRLIEARINNRPIQAWDMPGAYNEFYPSAYHRKNQTIRTQPPPPPTSLPPPIRQYYIQNQYQNSRTKIKGNQTKSWQIIDNICRVMFPILFLIFALIYWPILLFGDTTPGLTANTTDVEWGSHA